MTQDEQDCQSAYELGRLLAGAIIAMAEQAQLEALCAEISQL